MLIRKILLVDDDPNIRKLARMSLERVGKWEVVVASSGAEALQMACKTLPDLILLDVMMPEMDGHATLAQLKADPRTASIPVLLMTAKVPHDSMENMLLSGSLGVIVKPFDPLKLPSEIIELMAKNER